MKIATGADHSGFDLKEGLRKALAGPAHEVFDLMRTMNRELGRNLDWFWDRADVVVDDRRSPVRVQQAIRWNVFQLAQATWRTEGSGIPAKASCQ